MNYDFPKISIGSWPITAKLSSRRGLDLADFCFVMFTLFADNFALPVLKLLYLSILYRDSGIVCDVRHLFHVYVLTIGFRWRMRYFFIVE